ncbi:hypothetical protein Hanom_Chr07g00612511 [Helianthus anomalus]
MNSGGHQSGLFPFRFSLGSLFGSGLASGRVSRHESVASTGVSQIYTPSLPLWPYLGIFSFLFFFFFF